LLKILQYHQGSLPILVSMPHNGQQIPDEIAQTMTESALSLVDTDWYMDKVYAFAKELGCHVISPNYSRYVIDLNRPSDDKSLYPGADTTELCPTTQFDSQAIYKEGKQPTSEEIEMRVNLYWMPYHDQLSSALKQILQKHGYALLFEAHSIKSVVPRFFEGQLPDFNFGNYNECSSSKELTELVEEWSPSGYSKVVNGRFKGGYITRNYGDPSNAIDSLQLELSQATYMNESSLEFDKQKASQVIPVIEELFEKLIKHSQQQKKH